MSVKLDSKVCGVCGDKALGYNFNAVTCESCKAFFRRNAVLQKDFKCPFSNQCNVTTVTRRFCQKCRLDKCFSIGMCKDLIMSEEDKVLKRQKIEENRARKRRMSSFKSGFKKQKREAVSDSDSVDTNTSDGYHPNNPHVVSVINYVNPEGARVLSDDSVNSSVVSSSDDLSFENHINEQELNGTAVGQGEECAISNLVNNNTTNNCDNDANDSAYASAHAYQPSSLNGTSDVTKDVVEDVQRMTSGGTPGNSIESILCEAIKLEYEAYSSIAQSHPHSRELNDAERAKLNELIVANKALLTPVDDDLDLIGNNFKYHSLLYGNPKEKDPKLVDVINLTAIGIRRLIKMAKKINAFRNMCQEDQVALLKGGCIEIMILHSAMKYDPKKQMWKIPHTQEPLKINVDVLKLARGSAYLEHEKFIKTFDPKWMADENIILILCAIILFTPNRPRVIHQDVIKLEQNSYYYLLRRYLESIYPGCEAKSTFLKLIQKIAELHKLNDEVIHVYLDVNPSQVEPLLIEIFDLNK
ncbi:nuclear hormone receptor HR96 [Cylas formicarius]|uniref:nuclear hormone receptor HR96 n=1 Tax=Cylas formicarius TaxID=197179 RepID=UPI0029587602|nr:nuclear hormone receptor HR96 [Cylas formicarius]